MVEGFVHVVRGRDVVPRRGIVQLYTENKGNIEKTEEVIKKQENVEKREKKNNKLHYEVPNGGVVQL